MSDNYAKLVLRTYPYGSIRGFKNIPINLNKGEKEEAKYFKAQEEFKLNSLKAQSDTTENDTLKDDTLKVTFVLSKYAFTVKSDAILPNIEHVKALAKMEDEQLKFMDAAYRERDEFAQYPTVEVFEALIAEAVKMNNEDIGALDPDYTAVIKLHGSYTESHKKAIEYIIHSFVGNSYEKTATEIKVNSDDQELKAVLNDLSMSTYYDIQIVE